MEEPREIEHWKRISTLGSGAFGVVSLWQHTHTEEYIAIKKCKFKTNINITERQRKRWENEVEIMKTLNCDNIVSFKPLPKHLEAVLLKYNPTSLPLLSMEYCTKGNLRHVLTQVNNLSGLQEKDVRVVLADIANGVAHLHQHNITHRDIKPENIVLQYCNSRPGEVIYKLIDLGYAKELKDTIASFVGTLHYLAPEIMKTEKYNYSVDYWSLGTVAFEVICGVLPFLPHFSPVERFPYMEKKKPEHICIYQLHSGSVAFSSELLKENHVSTCFQQNMEIWLRQVLQFDPVIRGGTFPNNQNVFEFLLNILEKKIVTVFSVHTLEFYSYEINEGILISTLKDWIARDTKVQKSDQVLLSNIGVFDITDDKYVDDIVPGNDFNLFVFKKGAFINKETFTLPKYVTILFQNCTNKYKWKDLRQIYVKSLFFLSQEEKMIASLKTAFNLCTRYIQRLNVKLKDHMLQIHKTLNNVLVRIDCYHNLHSGNHKLNPNCPEGFKKCLIQFQQLVTELEKSVQHANELIKRVEALCERQVILDKVLPSVTPIIVNCDISSEVTKASELILKGGGKDDLTPREMVKTVSSALKEKDKLLNNKNFQSYSKAMLVAIKDVETLQTWMHNFLNHLKQLAKSIDDNQRNQYQSLLASVPEKKKINSLTSSLNHVVYWDTDTVIQENQELRCQLEDVLGEMFAAHKIFTEEMKRF